MSADDPNMLGRLWLDWHYESMNRYVSSSGRDRGAFCEAAYQLKCFFERSPAHAELVQRLATQQMCVASFSGPPAAMSLLCETATLAALATPGGRNREPAALRELLVAESRLRDGRLFDALDHLDNCRSFLAETSGTPFGRWAKAKEMCLRGELAVEAFELETAEGNFHEACDTATSLLSDPAALQQFVSRRLEVSAQRDDDAISRRRLEAEARWQVQYVALVAAQTGFAVARGARVAETFTTMMNTFDKVGRVPLVRPMLTIQALATLRDDQCHSYCEFLRETSGKWTQAFFEARGERLPSMHAATKPGSDGIKLAEVAVVESLTAIERPLRAGDTAQANPAWDAHIDAIVSARMYFPSLYAMGMQLRLALNNKEHEPLALQQFLQMIGLVVAENSDLLSNPQYRSMIDPSIDAAAVHAVENVASTGDTATASALLSLQRSRKLAAFPRLIGAPGQERTRCEEGIELLSDTLSRIHTGTSQQPNAVALITQQCPDGLKLICCDSESERPRVIRVAASFVDAMEDLHRAALDSAGSKLAAMRAGLQRAGRAAFDALPEFVRTAMAAHHYIMLAPDYSAGHDTLPFELLHDGEGYLFSRRVIARFTSLEQLAATLERRKPARRRRRALVIGIDGVQGDLRHAENERNAVRAFLTQIGFEAPDVKTESVTSRFITDRLSHVDIFHVSGHGQTALGTERLFLPDGGWLDSFELERRQQASLPFVYLSTCDLGQTRYLGGGRGRGLAFTFAEQGAAAVLAHTTPVWDDVSSALAHEFYKHALTKPVGEALRRARETLVTRYPASDIARLVLLGDPRHRLSTTEEPADRDDDVVGLLDRYFDPESSRAERSEVLTYMLRNGDRRGPVLAAAARLVVSREEAMYADEGADPQRLKDAIALADALGHRRSAGIFKARLARLSAGRGAPDAAEMLRAALIDAEALARTDDRWKGIRQETVALLVQQELQRYGVDIAGDETRGPDSHTTLPSFMSAIAGLEGFWDVDLPRLRVIEHTFEDVLWNAVLAGHPHRFESVPDRIEFVGALVKKLTSMGYLACSAAEVATPMTATALSCIWSAQDRGRFAPEECAELTKTLGELLDSVNTSWSPPEPALLKIISEVPVALEAALQRVENAGWTGRYEILETEISAVGDLARQVLQVATTGFPEQRVCATAFVAGVFLTMNRYEAAFQDDALPERLSAIYTDLSADVQALVVTASAASSLDQLARWRREDSQQSRR